MPLHRLSAINSPLVKYTQLSGPVEKMSSLTHHFYYMLHRIKTKPVRVFEEFSPSPSLLLHWANFSSSSLGQTAVSRNFNLRQ